MGEVTPLSQYDMDRIREVVAEFGDALNDVQLELQASGPTTTNAVLERRAMGSPKVRTRFDAESIVWAARRRVEAGIMVSAFRRSRDRKYA